MVGGATIANKKAQLSLRQLLRCTPSTKRFGYIRAMMTTRDDGEENFLGRLLPPEIWIDILSRLSQVNICHSCFIALS